MVSGEVELVRSVKRLVERSNGLRQRTALPRQNIPFYFRLVRSYYKKKRVRPHIVSGIKLDC